MSSVKAKTPAVVGVGASAGGIDAFRGFFEHLPSGTGLAFVVILHLPADRKSLLSDIIGRFTHIPVRDAADGCLVEPDHVFVPPPGVAVRFQDGRLYAQRGGADEPRESNPIDVFFDSLACALEEEAVGVILSGTGTDGALGLKAIRARGGLTLAQAMDGSPAQHGGMPASAIAAGGVDVVAPVESMGLRIVNARMAMLRGDALASARPDDVEPVRLRICAVLHKQVGHDFSGYKESTFLRRVQRRMQVLNVPTLTGYAERLEADAGEVALLFRDVLIGVTSFFRDPETFDVLKRDVIPRLFAGTPSDAGVRIWVAGCATGEEAYSLAMLVREHMDTMAGPVPRVQLLATDIDENAVATARAGRYPATLLEALTPARVGRFFVPGRAGTYTIAKSIRELCTFSVHSLTRDPPYSRINLITCRNLLIYLDADLQNTVIPSFHYALVPGGTLVLGSSESIAHQDVLFATVDRKHRIFERRDTPTPPLRRLARRSTLAAGSLGESTGDIGRKSVAKLLNRANLRVLERYAPAFVVLNAAGDIAQYSAKTGTYLEAAPGLPSQNIFSMCRQGLQAPLRDALREAVATGRIAERAHVPFNPPDQPLRRVNLIVDPLPDHGSTALYLVLFNENSSPGRESPPERESTALIETRRDQRLEEELRDAHDQLSLLAEEHGAALEELTSANEELRSINEEFQSTNEELETSKEEIQSINEELQTVNNQLSAKLEELDARNSDLKNLFESTQVATLFLDTFLVIRGFTPAVASIYNLIPSDVGRPLTDIVSRLRYSNLRADVECVLNTVQPVERRLSRLDNSAHYLMRLLPYRTPDGAVDGTVITFVDVTSIVRAEQHQRLLVDELNHRVKNMLTVVISMAKQTVRRSASLEEFSTTYLGRVHALATAYALLSDQHWKPVPLRDLLTEELRAFSSADRQAIVLDGPPLVLRPAAALALGLAIHELATNAVKYGSLSTPQGSVRLCWRLEGPDDAPAFVMEWAESGGPPVSPPVHRGLGHTLIERGLTQDLSAVVEVTFATEGVRALVRAPYEAISSNGAESAGEPW